MLPLKPINFLDPCHENTDNHLMQSTAKFREIIKTRFASIKFSQFAKTYLGKNT